MAQKLTKEWSTGYIVEHWVRVVSLVVLTFTGFYIHWPFMSGGPESFLMAWVRFFHFIAAYALSLGLIVRVYMAFRSTFDADWKDFSVVKNVKNVPDILAYYLFMKKTHKAIRKYNPLQALFYLFTGLVIIFTALTGGSLYHGNAFGFIPCPGSFQWVLSLLGGESNTRIWHILTMWFFIMFALVHVYMAIMITWVQKDRTFSSIFTGYKLKKN